MSIKGRLIITSAICLILVLGIGLTFIFKLTSLEEQMERLRTDSEIARRVFYLKTLAEEYSVSGAERAAVQWRIVNDELRKLLEISAKGNSQYLGTITKLINEHRALESIFSDLVRLHEPRASLLEGSPMRKELEQKLNALLTMKLQSMIDEATRLNRAGIVHMASSQKAASFAIIVFVIIMAGTTIGFAFLVYTRVIRPIIELTEGAHLIGSGNLDHEVEETGPGEVGQLAKAFNKMTKDLKTSYEELRTEISHRKQAEKTLAKQAELLARSNRDLEQFAYVASHDLQEPLRNVTNCVQLLEKRYKNEPGSDAAKWADYAVESCARMKDLIDDLLEFSRVGTRGNPLEPTDCEKALARALAALRFAIEESGAVVTHDPLPILNADTAQFSQLFQNLIANGIKFRGKEPPRLHVSAEKNDYEWLFTVQDNGIGIDPQYEDRIFVIFQRLHGKAEYPGTGIGLSVAKKIVERHGGRIWVQPNCDSGSTFCFTIPTGENENGH